MRLLLVLLSMASAVSAREAVVDSLKGGEMVRVAREG